MNSLLMKIINFHNLIWVYLNITLKEADFVALVIGLTTLHIFLKFSD